jgi:membrane-bound inhibitor of C-type lysozyme
MQKRTGWAIVIILVIIIGAAVWYWRYSPELSGFLGSTQPTVLNTVDYSCASGKSITAQYMDTSAPTTTAAGQPPVPTGSVKITLSDGRTMTLNQAVSADGARYGDDAFTFWSKGNGAFVTENGAQTFNDCVALAKDPGGLPQTYSATDGSFSLRYPAAFTVDSNYTYQELGPGKDISGVKFTIDPAIATGTNLGSDSYVSVEQLPSVQNCTADKFLDLGNAGPIMSVTDNGTTYSVASSTGAGAGNRYEEWVYAIPGTNPCIAVRYFIHYGVFENYPPGTVQRFDEASLLAQFDKIRRTLTIGQ